MALHSEWLRSNPKGPHGPIPPKGAEGALGPLWVLGSLGPEALRAGEPEKTSHDIMALRGCCVAT